MKRLYNVEKTPIIFNPVDLLFATPKGKNKDIRETIDKYLNELKSNKNSIYYLSMEKWLSISEGAISFSPKDTFGKKPIIFAGDKDFAPIEFLRTGTPVGLNVDLLQALSRAMGKPIEIRLMDLNQAQKHVLNGKADALTLLGPTKQRKKLYDFSEPTLEFEFIFFVRSDDITTKTIKDLEGKTVGVTKAGYPKQILSNNKKIKLQFIKNNQDGFNLLTIGKIDVLATEKWVGAYKLQKNGLKELEMIERPFTTNQASIAVRKGNTQLLEAINRGIIKLKQDNAIKKITEEWSPKRVVLFTKEKITRILIISGISLLLFLIIVTSLWVFVLKRQVREKTALLQKSYNNLEKIVLEKTEDLRESLQEKEVLMREIHHRVKNNMQVISSLLNLQSDTVKDKKVIEVLMNSQLRVQAMASIHETLYSTENIASLDFKTYVSKLVKTILQSYGASSNQIEFKIESENIKLGIDQGTPVGLIINELVSNSLKHAFPENRKGKIAIILKGTKKDAAELIVCDDGIGLPEDLDWKNTDTLGLRLVSILAENQLDGSIKLEREIGTCFIISFNLEKD